MSESMSETIETMTDESKMKNDGEIVIDLNENKKDSTPKPTNSPVVLPKRIDELTDNEKNILINNARSGIENPYYSVKLYKNGNTRICKKKKPTVSNQAVTSNGERTISSNNSTQKVYMTDNQLIWEHLLELESKYKDLYRKHKKLKSKYNDLYIEDDEPVRTLNNEPDKEPVNEQKEEQIINEPVVEPVQEPVKQTNETCQAQPVHTYRNWRSALMQKQVFI